MKLYKSLGVAAIAALTMTSCSDFLDADNRSIANQSADTYFSNNPELLRVTAYSDFQGIVTNIELQDQGTDLYINPRGADDGIFSAYIFNSSTSQIESWYKGLYKAINHANAMIKYGEDGSALVAEGRFLRCWGYYILTQHFGAVPYITEFIQSSKRDYPRTPLTEIYPALLEELNDLYTNSPLEATNHNGVASKQAVAALAAKVALAAGWDLGTSLTDEARGEYSINNAEYFTKAASWAEKAINGVQLTMSFEDKWSPFNEGNAEEIFSVQWERNGYPGNEASGGHNIMYDYMGYYGNCVDIGQKGTRSGGTNCHSVKAVNLWEKGDTRFYGTFMTTCYNSDKSSGKPVWSTEGYLAYFNRTAADLANLKIAYIFYPAWMTQAEVQADLATKKSQTVKDATLGVVNPMAVLWGTDQVTTWAFNANGSVGAATKTDLRTYMKGTTGNGMCVKKFDDPKSDNVTQGNCYRDIPVFHVSDMYLIAAEAYLMAGQDALALDKINAVRHRAGVKELGSFEEYEFPYVSNATFVQKKIDLVLDERARELYAERTRWEDLRRTRQLVRYCVEFGRFVNSPADMQNAQGETKWYRPIPQLEIENNTALDPSSQNPGY